MSGLCKLMIKRTTLAQVHNPYFWRDWIDYQMLLSFFGPLSLNPCPRQKRDLAHEPAVLDKFYFNASTRLCRWQRNASREDEWRVWTHPWPSRPAMLHIGIPRNRVCPSVHQGSGRRAIYSRNSEDQPLTLFDTLRMHFGRSHRSIYQFPHRHDHSSRDALVLVHWQKKLSEMTKSVVKAWRKLHRLVSCRWRISAQYY